MKPIDYRNETWASVQARVVDQRLEVWRAFLKFGPGTTREVAQKSGIDILNLRPRATELYQLGFLILLDPADSQLSTTNSQHSEGIYSALSDEQARQKFFQERRQHLTHQPELAL